MQATQARFDNIEIPDRPAVASKAPPLAGGLRKRVFLWGGIAAAALLAVAIIAMVFSGSSQKVARSPAEAPLIKGEDQPLKVTPGDPGGRQVPDRDLLVYERMHGTSGSKPPVERLLPEPEQPLAPPQPRSTVPPAEPPSLAPSDAVPPPTIAEPAPRPAPEVPAAAVPAKLPAAATTAQPKPPAAVATAQSKSPAATAQPKSPPAAARPEKPATAAKGATAERSAPAEKPKSASGRFQVQLLAGRDADEVKDAWGKLKAKNPDLLGPLSPTLARADLGDRGTFYRLRAGPLDSEAQARALCSRLSGRGASCIIIRPAS